MKNIKITRKLDVEKIREICMRYRLFTFGNNEEYAGMFNKANLSGSDEEFIQVAEIIWEFSDTSVLESEDFTFKTLCWYLFNECVRTIIE